MNRSFQNRIDKLSKSKPEPTYVFWVPPGRSDEISIKEANQWLKEAGLPANPNPMIFKNAKADKMQVEIIEDFGALIENARKHTNRIGERKKRYCQKKPT